MVIRRGTHHTKEKGFKFGSRNAVRLLLIVLAIGLLATISVEPAASQVSIAVTPTRIPLSLAPDETQSMEVTLINQGTEEVDLAPRVMTYAEGASGEPILGQDSTCSWFSPDKQALRLMPSEKGPFIFSATVPSGVEPGLYRFALTFDLIRSDSEGIGMTGGLAVIVELSVVPAENGGGSGFPLALTIILGWLRYLRSADMGVAIRPDPRWRREEESSEAKAKPVVFTTGVMLAGVAGNINVSFSCYPTEHGDLGL